MRKRSVEVFSGGCPLCAETVERVREMACASCEVTIVDLRDAEGERRARALGVGVVPAVAIDGRLVECCEGAGPDPERLRAAGLGRPL